MSSRLDSLDMGGQELFNLVGSVPTDQGDLAGYVVRVDHFCRTDRKMSQVFLILQTLLTVKQLYEFLGLHGRSNLDSDWVLNPSEVLDVRAVQLSRSISNPDEVRR
jgi:hypothetical protein